MTAICYLAGNTAPWTCGSLLMEQMKNLWRPMTLMPSFHCVHHSSSAAFAFCLPLPRRTEIKLMLVSITLGIEIGPFSLGCKTDYSCFQVVDLMTWCLENRFGAAHKVRHTPGIEFLRKSDIAMSQFKNFLLYKEIWNWKWCLTFCCKGCILTLV